MKKERRPPMESNISRDHIALEAMKIILAKTTREITTPTVRFKAWLGNTIGFKSATSYPDPKVLARMSYDIADAMVEERERRNENE